MKTLLWGALALGVVVCASDATATNGSAENAAAERIVVKAAQVKEGDFVLVRGPTTDAEFLESMAIASQMRGAMPIVLMNTPGFENRWFQEVPARFDDSVADGIGRLYDSANVDIEVGDLWAKAPAFTPERVRAVGESWVRVMDKRYAHNVRHVVLGNGFYPSDGAAQALGVSRVELARVFWSALGTDPARIDAQGEAVKGALANARELRFTSVRGTDLRVRVEGRPLAISDGSFTADALKKGGNALETWLPAGEAYLVPVPGTAAGKLFVERLPYEGGFVENLELTFAAGKVTGIKATPSKAYDVWKARYDAAPVCREQLGVVDFGINPDLKAKSGKKLLGFPVPGVVTMMLGNNSWAAGGVGCAYAMPLYVADLTAAADGNVFLDKGEFKIKVASATE